MSIEEEAAKITDEIAKRIWLNQTTISWSQSDKNSLKNLFIEFAREIIRVTKES